MLKLLEKMVSNMLSKAGCLESPRQPWPLHPRFNDESVCSLSDCVPVCSQASLTPSLPKIKILEV